MKLVIAPLFSILIGAALTTTVSAQESGDYHPFLSDKFNIGVGIFSPKKSLEIQVDGSDPGDNVNFEESLRLDNSESTPSMNFRWRFGEKWAFWGQY